MNRKNVERWFVWLSVIAAIVGLLAIILALRVLVPR
jgi:hypothetical protein